MNNTPTPETDALDCELHNPRVLQDRYSEMMEHARKLERERDEARAERDICLEDLIKARKHREQLNSLLQSYEACWDEIKAALGEPEEGDQTCDLDRVLKAIRERDEAREKIKRQAERIRELEGATNHAGGMKKIESIKYHGTDETDAMVELWESCHLPADFARRMEAERNEARRLADTRLDQLEAITSSEPKDYLGLVYACKSHRKHIAQLIKERDEAREALIPFITLNPNSQRVQKKWDGFVEAAKKALERSK